MRYYLLYQQRVNSDTCTPQQLFTHQRIVGVLSNPSILERFSFEECVEEFNANLEELSKIPLVPDFSVKIFRPQFEIALCKYNSLERSRERQKMFVIQSVRYAHKIYKVMLRFIDKKYSPTETPRRNVT